MNESGGKKILLIGGAGYVGSVLTKHLLNCGYPVRCLDFLLYRDESGVIPFLSDRNYEFQFGDFTDPEVLNSALKDISNVVLLAGLVGDPIVRKYPDAAQAINMEGMLQTLHHLNGRGLNRVVFVSTCSNYGVLASNEIADESFETNPVSAYAIAKVAVEKELLALEGSTDYDATILRFATAFGISPRMRFDLTVSEFTRALFFKKELVVYDPDTWRPYCHVEDFAFLIRRVLEAPLLDVSFQVFNVGTEENNFTKRGLVEVIQSFVSDGLVRYEERGSDPRNYRVNFQKVRERLNFKPRYRVEDGVRELVQAFRQGLFGDRSGNQSLYGNCEIRYDYSKISKPLAYDH